MQSAAESIFPKREKQKRKDNEIAKKVAPWFVTTVPFFNYSSMILVRTRFVLQSGLRPICFLKQSKCHSLSYAVRVYECICRIPGLLIRDLRYGLDRNEGRTTDAVAYSDCSANWYVLKQPFCMFNGKSNTSCRSLLTKFIVFPVLQRIWIVVA